MKNNDNKANSRLKSIVALILVMCVGIGLLTSTAIRLATAAYLMQSSKKINTGIDFIDDYVNDKIDDTQNTTKAPTTAAPTTTKPAETTTKAPDTTKGSETTTKAPSTTKPTTQAPTESTTSEADVVRANQSVLKSYNDVLASNKVSNTPGFTKVTSRSLDLGFLASVWFSGIDSQEEIANYLAGETVKAEKGKANNLLCLNDYKNASIINDADFDTVKAAVKSSSKQIVYMGYLKNLTDGTVVHAYNKTESGEIEKLIDYNDSDYKLVEEVEAVKLVIEFNDEVNPAPIKNGKTDSFIASVFPVVTSEQVRVAMDKTGVEEVDVTYTDCSIEMYYNIETAEIYSLKQNVNYDVAVKDGILSKKLLKGSVSEVNAYSGFVY